MPTLKELVEQVAPLLDTDATFPWSRSKRFDAEDAQEGNQDWRQYLVGPNHAEIFFSNTWAGKGRLHISGSFSNDIIREFSPKQVSITVAETASPARIAAEIKRRLLPQYLPELTAVLARQVKSQNYAAAKLNTYAAALTILGITLSNTRQAVAHDRSRYFGPNSARVVEYDDATVELDGFRVTPEQLKRISDAVPELFTPEEN